MFPASSTLVGPLGVVIWHCLGLGPGSIPPTLFPFLPPPSWCLGVGLKRGITQPHTAREGRALATGPPEIQSSCCKRNLMVCPHPALDEITSALGKVTRTSLLICAHVGNAGQRAYSRRRERTRGRLGPTSPLSRVLGLWARWETPPRSSSTPKWTHTPLLSLLEVIVRTLQDYEGKKMWNMVRKEKWESINVVNISQRCSSKSRNFYKSNWMGWM